MKNIIICCDGTGNQFNETYSNVIKLYTCLKKDPTIQLAFYDPGVGTMSDPNIVTPWSKSISKIGGLAFGWGLKQNVTEAYAYLMEYYQEGDRIFLFGFSRGAYTVRVIAALLYQAGLLEKGCQHLIPYAWQVFKKSIKPRAFQIARQFKKTYSRDVTIYFVGLWDTVTSMGIFNHKKLPYTTNNPGIKNIRHAVAIDERRTYYRQNLFGAPSDGQDSRQVWFAGVHSDIGGSYPFNESGLSQITLEWMIDQAACFGLYLDAKKVDDFLYDSKGTGHSKPNYNEEVHNSLTIFWWILELIPRLRRRWPKIYLPLGRRRQLYMDYNRDKISPIIHETVLKKIEIGKYNPPNFNHSIRHQVEPHRKPKILQNAIHS